VVSYRRLSEFAYKFMLEALAVFRPVAVLAVEVD
jgi:hypothetical protein